MPDGRKEMDMNIRCRPVGSQTGMGLKSEKPLFVRDCARAVIQNYFFASKSLRSIENDFWSRRSPN